MKKLFSLAALALLPFVLTAQENQSGETAGTQSDNRTGKIGVSGNASDPKSLSANAELDKIFDLENDMINPTDGTLVWKNKIFKPEDNIIFRERFERYLSSPVPEESNRKNYQEKYNEIYNLLDLKKVKRIKQRDNLWKALFALYDLAAFEDIDDNQSILLADVVYKAIRIRADSNEMRMKAVSLQDKKDKLRFQLEVKGNTRRYKEEQKAKSAKSVLRSKSDGSGGTANSGKTTIPTPSASSIAPSPREVFLTEDLKTVEARILSNETDRLAMELKAKLEFQSTFIQMSATGRYEHALLAQKFYRTLFNANNQNQIVGKKEIEEYLPVSNFTASGESVEGVLREICAEVNKTIRSSDLLYKSGKKYLAFRKLLDAFAVGEHTLPVIFYPEDRKMEFLGLWLLTHQLAKEAESRELDAVEKTLAEIMKIAPDFPEAEVRGKLRAAKQASQMSLLRAKQLFLAAGAAGTPEAMENAMAGIQEAIAAATEFWPQNPGIAGTLNEVFEQTNLLSRLAPEFDRLVAGNKKREIYDRKVELTAALMGDASRRDKLSKILEEVATLEAVLNQVKAQTDARNVYLAWDMLAKAEEIDPNDSEVIMTKARLVPLTSNYSLTLAKAAQEEASGNYALALNHFLAAKKLNPASEVCIQAVKRTAEKLLEQKTGGNVSAGTQNDADFNF